MRSSIVASLVGLLVLASPLAGAAQGVVLVLDPVRSSAGFTLGAFLHTVHGSFRLKSGTLRLDTVTGQAQGEIDVDLTTGATGIGARDDVMRTRVLETQRYPDAVFRADSFSGRLNADGASTLDIQGRLAIHGEVHALAFHATAVANGPQLTIVAHAAIPYVQWGMRNPSTLFLRVDERVEVDIRAIAEIRPATP